MATTMTSPPYAVGGLAVAATAVAWAGALMAVVLGRTTTGRFMRPLVYLALLFFFLTAMFDILPESKRALSWPTFAAAVAAGYGVFWLVGTYVAPICPACALRQFEDGHHHTSGSAVVFLALVLGLHCFIDGLGVTVASTVEAAFGIRMFGAIAVHKLPEGFALVLMLLAGGRTTWGALAWAIAIEAATLAGALTGWLWAQPSEFWLAVVLAHIGGTFLYLCVSGLKDALSSETPPRALAHS